MQTIVENLDFSTKAPPAERARTLLAALPDTVRIGPHDFRIEIVSAVDAEQRKIYGHFLPLQQRVDVSESHPSPTMLAATVIHEFLHGVWRNARLSDDTKVEEHTVACLGDGLVGLFRDNPWLAGWIAGAVK